MPDIPLKFTRAEYAERLQKTRRAMEEKGVDLLIVSDPSNMNWLTGYNGWSFYVHQAVIVPPEGEPIFFGRGMDAVGARFTAYLSEDNINGTGTKAVIRSFRVRAGRWICFGSA